MIFYTAGIYIFIALISSTFALLGEKKNKKLFFVLSFFVVCFFSAIRRDVGADFIAYMGNFIAISNGVRGRLEPGYWLLNKITAIFSSDYQSIFIVTSLITFGLLFYSFKKYSIVPSFTILLMFFLREYEMILTIIRQGIAIAIFAYSLKYIENKNFFKYLIAIIIATSFHYSAVILIPLYFILNKRLKLEVFLFYIFLGISLFIVRYGIGSLSALFHSEYYQLLVNMITEPGPIYLLKALFNLLISISIIYKYKEIISTWKYGTIFCNLYFLYTVISLSFLGLNLGYRFIAYFEFFSIFLIPILFKVYFKNLWIRNMIVIVFIIFIAARFYMLLPISMYKILPYQSFLF